VNYANPSEISGIQPLVEALQDVKPGHSAESTQKHLNSILAQLMTVLGAECLTYYAQNPWSGAYELRAHRGLRYADRVTDRLETEQGGAYDRVLDLVRKSYADGSFATFLDNPRELYRLKRPERLTATAQGTQDHQDFVELEGIRNVLIVFAMDVNRYERQPVGVLFINWRESYAPQTSFLGNHMVKQWMSLLSHALASATEVLLHRSNLDVALLGRHQSLAMRITKGLVEITAEGPAKIAQWLSEDGLGTKCMIFENDGNSLKLITDPIHDGLGSGVGACHIAQEALNWKRTIHIANFDDPRHSEIVDGLCKISMAIKAENLLRVNNRVPEIPRFLSELAIPIMKTQVDKDGNRERVVTYVFVLARPHAYAFSDEEIALLKASLKQFETVLRKAQSVADATAHDARNLLDILPIPSNVPSLAADWQKEPSDLITNPSLLDVLAFCQVLRWSFASSDIVSMGLCGLSVTRRRPSTGSYKSVVDIVCRAERCYLVTGDSKTVVEAQCGEDLPPALDEELIGQCLWNLVHNAGKAVQSYRVSDASTPKIEISVTTEGQFVVIRVRDTGRGFFTQPMEDGRVEEDLLKMKTCWDPGFKAGPGQGKGYGLFIARKCIEALGGRTVAANRADMPVRADGTRGAQMEVYLPLGLTGRAAVTSPSDSTPESNRAKTRKHR
jgi:hypothetical protein